MTNRDKYPDRYLFRQTNFNLLNNPFHKAKTKGSNVDELGSYLASQMHSENPHDGKYYNRDKYQKYLTNKKEGSY